MTFLKFNRQDARTLLISTFILTFVALLVSCAKGRANQQEKILENRGPLVEVTSPSVKTLIATQLPTADRFLLTRPVGDIVGICAHIPLRSIGDKADQGFFALTQSNGEIHSLEPTSDPRLCG